MEKLDPGHSEWSKNIFSVHFPLKMLPINFSIYNTSVLKKNCDNVRFYDVFS